MAIGPGKTIIFDPGYKEAGSVEAFYDLKWTVEAISNIIENALKYTDENRCYPNFP